MNEEIKLSASNLEDYFAGEAMGRLVEIINMSDEKPVQYKTVAISAYMYADAMMKERVERKTRTYGPTKPPNLI